MTDPPVHYRSPDEDSGRWAEFGFRPGDIVISTRSKSGTTWVQMLCALLIFRTPDPPRPLTELSPWLDWLVIPIEEVLASLEAQTHRRFIKTHTPLDGIPVRDDVTYITVARHPLDLALSLHHQGRNLDRARIRALAGTEEAPTEAVPERGPVTWLRDWIGWDGDPRASLDSLPGVLLHLTLAWERRHRPNMVLLHFDDLLADLPGQMQQLAQRLDIEISEDELDRLSGAASFASMKANSDRLAPDHQSVLKDRAAFFRQGTSGGGAGMLDPADVADYHRRAARLAPDDLLVWLHSRRRPVARPLTAG